MKKLLILSVISIFIAGIVALATDDIPNIERPQAQTVVPHDAPAIPEVGGKSYALLASRANWSGGKYAFDEANKAIEQARAKAEFEKWLAAANIKTFKESDVNTYFGKMVDALTNNEKNKQNQTYYRWRWFPLAGEDSPANTGWVTLATNSCVNCFTSTNSIDATLHRTDLKSGFRQDYALPIPADVLATAALVRDAWPTAEFDVSVIDAVHDPFLAVRFPWGREIIAMWAEPGFGK